MLFRPYRPKQLAVLERLHGEASQKEHIVTSSPERESLVHQAAVVVAAVLHVKLFGLKHVGVRDLNPEGANHASPHAATQPVLGKDGGDAGESFEDPKDPPSQTPYNHASMVWPVDIIPIGAKQLKRNLPGPIDHHPATCAGQLLRTHGRVFCSRLLERPREEKHSTSAGRMRDFWATRCQPRETYRCLTLTCNQVSVHSAPLHIVVIEPSKPSVARTAWEVPRTVSPHHERRRQGVHVQRHVADVQKIRVNASHVPSKQ